VLNGKDLEKHNAVLDLLRNAVGFSYATRRKAERYFYAADPSAEPRSIPDYVVLPENVKQIQAILKIANKERIPVTPRVGGLTLSGLAIPYGGGILLDLKRMNRILDVNEKSMYAVIECGVSIGQLKTYLEQNHPALWFSVPHAPPTVGVISNVLIHGAGHLSLRYGANSDLVNGMEVVLPTGELLKSGSSALGKGWLTKDCLPDFMGLFEGWFGATGIVSKASIQLWPKPEVRDALFCKIQELAGFTELIEKLTRSNVCDDICAYSWTGTSGRKRFQLPERPLEIPELTMDLMISGKSQAEVELKKAIIRKIFSEINRTEPRVEEYSRSPNIMEKVLMIPRPFPFMDLLQGGGTEYLGCYIPIESTDRAYKLGKEVAKETGFQYLHFLRPLRGGHLLAILFIFPFDNRDASQADLVRDCVTEISEQVMELGGVPWKPAPVTQRAMKKFLDPIYIEFMKKIRRMLDPNGIMARGQWIL
jgi:glycolate oxidase